MKIGDTLYCKKSCYNDGILLFQNTYYYKICKVSNNCEIIGLYPILFSGYPRILFYVTEKNRYHSAYNLYIWDYFYTESEIRLLKLENI